MNLFELTSSHFSSFNITSTPVLFLHFYEENFIVKISYVLPIFVSLPLCPERNIIINLSIYNFHEYFLFFLLPICLSKNMNTYTLHLV